VNRQQVGRAGEHFVAAELHRRGAYAVTFAGNMPETDILAADAAQTRTVFIQVKTKAKGDWQTSTSRGRRRRSDPDERRFWVFVDLGPDAPSCYIVPEWWIQNEIYRTHEAYLDRQPDRQRPITPGSTHSKVTKTRIAKWQNRWELLGLFGE